MSDKWNKRFLELANHIRQWSKDPGTKIGAVIVDPETKKVVSMGYNGFPRGVDDSEERLNDRETKLQYTVHAEENAIIQAGVPLKGYSIYVYPSIMKPVCCAHCAALIVQSGIKTVYGQKIGATSERWMKQAEASMNILKEGGVEYIELDING